MVADYTNLVIQLRTEAEYQRRRNGEEDSAELAALFQQAADAIVALCAGE